MKNKRLIDFQEGLEKPGMADVHSEPVLDDRSISAVAHIEHKVSVEEPTQPPKPRPEKRATSRQRSEQPTYQRFKRVMDIVVSVVALTIFGLLLPLIALAIKIDSRGPVFFSQDRIGMNRRERRRGDFSGDDQRKVLQPGRPFRIIKLRTMCEDAEIDGPKWASKDDSRVTRIGRFLRKTRLDEVPQFLNVLRGEMSLIGPRPERLCFIRKLEKEVPHYRERLVVMPGITGLAQVKLGYDTSTESVRRKVLLDRTYIKKSGVRTDFRVILSTIKVVITGEGAV